VNGLTEWENFRHAYNRVKNELNDTIEYCLEHRDDPEIIDKLREVKRITDGVNRKVADVLRALQAESRNIRNSRTMIGEVQGYITYLNGRTRYIQDRISELSRGGPREEREEPRREELKNRLIENIKEASELGILLDTDKKQITHLAETGTREKIQDQIKKLDRLIQEYRSRPPKAKFQKCPECGSKNIDPPLDKPALRGGIRRCESCGTAWSETTGVYRHMHTLVREKLEEAKKTGLREDDILGKIRVAKNIQEAVNIIEKLIEETKKPKEITPELTKDQKENIEKIWANFVLKMRGINENMNEVRRIATVTHPTPEEKEIVKLAVRFQNFYHSSDLKPPIQNKGKFLDMIGEIGIAGYRRMGIIRDQLVPLLNDIEKAYEDIKTPRKKQEREVNNIKVDYLAKIRQVGDEPTEDDKKKIEEIKKNLKKSAEVLKRLKKIEELKKQFSVFKRYYKDEIHNQIVRWNETLTEKKTSAK